MIKTTFQPSRENLIRNKKYPLIIYLHGAGERGRNIKNLYRHGIPELIIKGREIDAYVLSPQCPGNCVWDNIVFDVKALIDSVISTYNLDTTRISLTGSSMGGFGTFQMAFSFNNFFSCIAPVAGGGNSWRSSNLIGLPIKMYHGNKDDAVPIEYSYLMYNTLKWINKDTELVVLDGYGHNDGIDHAYFDLDIIEYLLSHTNENRKINEEFLHEMF